MDYRKFAKEKLSSGKSAREVKEMLVESGIPYSEADRIVSEASGKGGLQQNYPFRESKTVKNKYPPFLIPSIIIIFVAIFSFLVYFQLIDISSYGLNMQNSAYTTTTLEKPMTEIIFDSFFESAMQEEYLPYPRPERKVSMDTNDNGNENYFGTRWTIDSKDFYAGIVFKNNSEEADIYRASVTYNDFVSLEETTAYDIMNAYFEMPARDQISVECSGFCKSRWKDADNRENGMLVISVQNNENKRTIAYFCSVPNTGSLYGIKNCVDDVV